MRYVEEMYKYVGLEMTSQVRNHIEISTHGETVKGTYEVCLNVILTMQFNVSFINHLNGVNTNSC